MAELHAAPGCLEKEEEVLLAGEAPAGPSRQRFVRVLTVATLTAGAAVLGAVVLSMPSAQSVANTTGLQGKVAAEPVPSHEAQKRFEAREQLLIEQDLRNYVTAHMPNGVRLGGMRTGEQRAGVLFDHVVESSGLHRELNAKEREAFKDRFLKRMLSMAEHTEGSRQMELKYVQHAQDALESEKPVVTEAFVRSLNGANLGFKSKMREWMAFESQRDFQRRLGRAAMPEDRAEEFRKKSHARREETDGRASSADPLPVRFDAREQWPECAEVIGRIHNQGQCGSCWVFGAMGPLDSRMCIKTIGAGQMFNLPGDVLSRGHAASCVVSSGGCSEGWEYYVYEYIQRSPGLPSDGCVPYFASGENAHEFDSSMSAPHCSRECDPAYPRQLADDMFRPTGVWNYRLELDLDGTKTRLDELRRELLNGPCAFGIFVSNAFMAYNEGIYGLGCGSSPNHAVHAIGYGEGYFLGQNSWGKDWGDSGRFKAAPCVPTDFTCPGAIETAHYPALPVPTHRRPRPPPPPAPPVSEIPCPLDDEGCFTSPGFAQGEDYPPSHSCIMSYKFGKINVVHFDTEERYDYMEINGQRYSGDEGPQDVTPKQSNILWSADSAAQAKGWKICPEA